VPLGALLVVAVAAWREGRAVRRAWFRRSLVAIAPIAVGALLMNGLFFPDGQTVLARFGPAAVSAEGLAFAAVVVARLALITGAVVLVAATTGAEELAEGLAEAGLPHPLPAYAPIAGGLLPELRRRASDIADAQRARGLSLRRGGLPNPEAARALVAPLLAAVLDDVEARTRALEARGIGLEGRRTSMVVLEDGPGQRAGRWLIVGASLAALIAARWPR